MDKVLNIIKNDPWLEPYADAINGRHQHVVEKEKELVGKKTLSDFATGHMYFGLHRTDKGSFFMIFNTLSIVLIIRNYLTRTFTITFLTPSGVIPGACASSGKKMVNIPGFMVR